MGAIGDQIGGDDRGREEEQAEDEVPDEAVALAASDRAGQNAIAIQTITAIAIKIPTTGPWWPPLSVRRERPYVLPDSSTSLRRSPEERPPIHYHLARARRGSRRDERHRWAGPMNRWQQPHQAAASPRRPHQRIRASCENPGQDSSRVLTPPQDIYGAHTCPFRHVTIDHPSVAARQRKAVWTWRVLRRNEASPRPRPAPKPPAWSPRSLHWRGPPATHSASYQRPVHRHRAAPAEAAAIPGHRKGGPAAPAARPTAGKRIMHQYHGQHIGRRKRAWRRRPPLA
jgi:hypothetical protein